MKRILLSVGIILLLIVIAVITYTPRLQSVAAFFAPLASLRPAAGANILFVGDMSFDRYIRQVADKRGGEFIFSCVDPLLKSADVVVGNLEGPITENASQSAGTPEGSPDNFQFTFPRATAALLYEHNIRIVDIGNNHIDNFGKSGLLSTQNFLQNAGVGYFGGLAGDEPVYRSIVGGMPLSFVSYNQFGGQSAQKVADTIAAERTAGRTVVVFAHWGDEYSASVEKIRSVAVLFGQSGASIVIGAHPHIVLTHEYIGNSLVYYSLGNFIFDQYWDARVTHGLSVLVHIDNNGATAREYPVVLKTDGQTCPA